MAKQFNILATDVDLQRLEIVLRQLGDTQLLSCEATDDLAGLKPLDALPIPVSKAGEVPLFCYLAPIGLPPKIVMERDSPVKVHIDVESSHVIEFWRPFYDGHIMRPGRLFHKDKAYANRIFGEKDPAFRVWAKRVMARVKKSLRRDPTLFAYVGEDAGNAIARGSITVWSTGGLKLSGP